jgi:hypothetical protein
MPRASPESDVKLAKQSLFGFHSNGQNGLAKSVLWRYKAGTALSAAPYLLKEAHHGRQV